MTPNDNSAIAAIIRDNLKKHGLDIPGTAYFDESLDNLCAFYSGSAKKGYFVLSVTAVEPYAVLKGIFSPKVRKNP